ncbi:MAG TPA: hypothetical protein VH142_11840, partial [Polyangiaceae bacterium]|nr:hypothetical protein [Polyangiaceae bacterium]
MRRALVIAGLLLATSTATAQDNRAESDRLFNEGIALYGKKDFDGARGKFADAYAKFPSPNALFNLARTEQLLGRCSLALPHYRAYVALPENPRITAQNRVEARQRTEECLKTIGRVQIHAPAAVNVSVDGRPMPWEPGDVLEVSPGAHVVTLQSGTDSKRRETQCDGGQVVTISWDDEKVIVSNGNQPPKTESYRPALGWILPGVVGGVGLVGLGLGVGFGVVSSNAASDAKASASPGICANPSAPACQTYRGHASDANSAAIVSIVGYVGGGVLLGTAIVMAIVWPTKTR